MAKNTLKICKNCGTPIAANSKICPVCHAKQKKPFYTRWWFIFIVVLIVLVIIGSSGGENTDTNVSDNTGSEVITENTDNPSTDQPSEPVSSGNDLIDGMHPEFKESVDKYEAFFDEYCEFMTKYNESDDALSMLSDYSDFMEKYADAMEGLDEIGEQEMNSAELKYYSAAMSRISKKLLAIAE